MWPPEATARISLLCNFRKYNHKWCRQCIEAKKEEYLKKAEDSNNTKESIQCEKSKPWNEFELCDKETGTRRNKCNMCKNKRRQEIRRLRAGSDAGSRKGILRSGSSLDETTAAARASVRKNPPQYAMRTCDTCGRERWLGDFLFGTATAPTHVNTAKMQTNKDVGNVAMEDTR